MDQPGDIYQEPQKPPPPPPPRADVDIPVDRARLQTRRNLFTLVGIVAALLLIGLVYLLRQEAKSARLAALQDALNAPTDVRRAARTNAPAAGPGPQMTALPENMADLERTAPPDLSPQKMAEAMGQLRLANEYLQARELDRAEEEARKALQIWPGMNAALRLLGMVYTQRGQFDQAIAALEKARQSDPFSPETYNNMAAAYLQKRRFDQAEELLLTCLQIRPDFALGHLNLGLLYVLWGRYAQAIEHLEQAHQQMPENPSVLNNLAVCFIRLNRLEDARARLKTLLAARPGTGAAYFNMAITYALEQNVAEAMNWIRQGAAHSSPAECQTFLSDPDFDRLRGVPDFQQFVRGLYPDLPAGPGT